ncbi:MAG: VWA domain-containing protein [Gammaproteobacteria bacterium]|nr:VWA domain-containing protein [Gammaproteobacteria bacterium]MDH3467209.1 VWA domain-containing protein [Gammaproteobacteria bacterium]
MKSNYYFRTVSACAVALGSLALLVLFSTSNATDARQLFQQDRTPKIQLAILLDTSSSMSGLINQSRNQLWQVVNEFSQARQHGKAPILEVAVYEYGNSRLSTQSGYIRQVTGLTSELDQVSEALFSLTTSGGEEYCGLVIQDTVNELQWSQSSDDIKAIFIAGNEPFTQGPVRYQHAIQAARQKGIVVNTIHAGDYETGANSGWKHGAQLAGGDYMHIDQNYVVAHIVAPQDQRLVELNAQLNKTYIPYGTAGELKAARQVQQDERNAAESPAQLAGRVASKASSFYSNENWDLVDAMDSGEVDLDEIETQELPQPMRSMDKQQRREFVDANAKQRKLLQREIKTLSESRDRYVAQKKQEAAEKDVNTVDDALISAVRKQGERSNFVF